MVTLSVRDSFTISVNFLFRVIVSFRVGLGLGLGLKLVLRLDLGLGFVSDLVLGNRFDYV